MRRKFLTALIVSAAFGVTACGVKTPDIATNSTTAFETEAESISPDAETSAVTAATPDINASAVVTTTAEYVKNETAESDGKLMFRNDTNGEFLCYVSEFTDVPDTFTDGAEYTIVHSDMMTMSLPGILPKVYAIREVNSDVTDTYAELVAEDDETLTFVDMDGYEFMTDKFGDQVFVIGDGYLVSHTAEMTRSNPGKYMDVRRILGISAMERAEAAAQEANPLETSEGGTDIDATLGVEQD